MKKVHVAQFKETSSALTYSNQKLALHILIQIMETCDIWGTITHHQVRMTTLKMANDLPGCGFLVIMNKQKRVTPFHTVP